MDAAKRTPGRAFCPKCGQKYAVPEEELQRHPGLRFRATCRQCNTPFSVRWQDGGMITDTDELEVADDVGQGRNVLPKGSRVGKYEVEEMIASGGSASVYKAFEMGANRTVALKVLHQAADSDYGERFRREVEVQGNLKHPNLMPIFDQGAIDGKPYYTMELLHQPTTFETIIGLFRDGRLAYNAALRTLDSLDTLLRQVLLPVTRAIDFANKNGVIHRDLKPGNVILDARTLHVYVIDFGICHVSRQTGQRLVLRAGGTAAPEEKKQLTMGTVRFMPPEQARGDAPSEQGDIWALGALLFYTIVGDSPIAPAIDLRRVGIDKRIANLKKIAASSREAGDHEEAGFYEQRVEQLRSGTVRTSKDVLKDAQQATYRPPPDGTNPALAAVAMRAMAAHPRDRYPTADHFALEIKRYLDGRPVRAYVASLRPGRAMFYKSRLHFRRNRTALLVGGIALLLAVVVGVFLLLKAGADRRSQIENWVAQARASNDPAVQQAHLNRALALQPDHEEGNALLALARKYIPIREKLSNARSVKAKVRKLRTARQYDEAAKLAEDAAAVLEGSVLPDLRSLPKDYPGRGDEQEAQKLADFLRGRRIVKVGTVQDGVSVGLVSHRSRSNPQLLWDKLRDWGVAPLGMPQHALEPGSYVLVFTREAKSICYPFVISHTTKPGGRVSCPLDPRELPDGMLYIRGTKRMRYGDLRFSERTEIVEVDAFLIDAYEVTNARYAEFLNSMERDRRRLAVPRRLLPGPGDNTDPLWTEAADGTWTYPGGTATEPVASISYLDASAYAAWAGKRLPTPQEWELAARGFDGRDYPFGNDINPSTCNAHTGSVARNEEFLEDRSPFGVYHMGGNVAEWTDARGGDQAMVKGGSFDLPRYRVIVASFGRRRADLPYADVGFRCAKTVSERR